MLQTAKRGILQTLRNNFSSTFTRDHLASAIPFILKGIEREGKRERERGKERERKRERKIEREKER